MSSDEELLDYGTSSDDAAGSEDEFMEDVAPAAAARSAPVRRAAPRPLRSGSIVKFLRNGATIWRAPLTLRGAAPAAAAASQPQSHKRKASPTRDVPPSGGKKSHVAAAAAAAPVSHKKKVKSEDGDDGRFEGRNPTPIKLRLSKTSLGAAPINPAPVPPIGTFVNLSEGLTAMQPEVTQYPYTGPVLKKVVSSATAAADGSGSSTKGPLPVIVPSFAAWFDLAAVHEIERACLPEFFEASKTTAKKMYKETRNFIVQTFRQNPRVYLSLTAIRKAVVGDACSLQRIHSFLESWGLINFHVDPGSMPTMSSPGSFNSAYPLLAHSAYTGFSPLIQTRQSPDVLQHLIHHQAHPNGNSALRRSVLQGPATSLSHEPLQAEYAIRRDPSLPIQCRACSSTSVENVRYVCRQKRDYLLCADCFFDGKYPHLLSSGDFERYLQDDDANATDAERSGEWSREEVFRLLQAISMHEDDWESVADHVRTRTKDECALKFVQLPIEEPFLDQYYNSLAASPSQPSATSLAAASTTVSSAATLASIPFAETPNPILSQVAFLASYVSPSVAAAGAQAALTYCSIQDMAGQAVRTVFGPGKLVVPRSQASPPGAFAAASFSSSSFTRPDGILTVDLPWGRLYTHASQISLAPTPAASAAVEKAEKKKEPVWTRDVVSLSGHVLQSAARKSVELAEEEERKVLRFVAQLTGALMKRIELKLTHLDELEAWATSHKTVYDASASAYYSERLTQNAAAAAEAATAAQSQAQAQAQQQQSNTPMETNVKHETNHHLPATHAHLQHISSNTPADTNPFRAY